jgi:hypothetical protein
VVIHSFCRKWLMCTALQIENTCSGFVLDSNPSGLAALIFADGEMRLILLLCEL